MCPRWLAVPLSKRALLCQTPKVGAQCGSAARWDLCGGHPATGGPTATLKLSTWTVRHFGATSLFPTLTETTPHFGQVELSSSFAFFGSRRILKCIFLATPAPLLWEQACFRELIAPVNVPHVSHQFIYCWKSRVQ